MPFGHQNVNVLCNVSVPPDANISNPCDMFFLLSGSDSGQLKIAAGDAAALPGHARETFQRGSHYILKTQDSW